jgi:hypothetical protein
MILWFFVLLLWNKVNYITKIIALSLREFINQSFYMNGAAFEIVSLGTG